jgi:hypothetical protein
MHFFKVIYVIQNKTEEINSVEMINLK